MAYTPTVWKNGDVITAELLNHLETGVQNEQVGPEGPAGPTGAAAGFGTPTATVDANVGTPAVEITATGDDTAKVFAFAFSNLKGEPGAAGAKGEPGATGPTGAAAGFGTPTATVDANVGTPAVEITATGDDTAKVFAFAFSNLKGEPGAAGAKGEPGATGATGATGASVTAIELYKDESGAITGGKATLSDASEITITVTTTPTV